MRKARTALLPALFVAALLQAVSLNGYAQEREKFVISARAGGVNAVTGRAMLAHRNSEWQVLTIKEDLETGDVVKTGVDGRVEMLLNPGSYLRIGEDSEFELTDNSLENLEVRLVRGTAIVEVTGPDDAELFIGITTPHTRMSIIRRGLYRVNVLPGDTTELIVRKGRVMLEGSHTRVNGGNKVVFSGRSFSVAKLEDADKKVVDKLETWSKDRAETLAKANSQISRRTLGAFAASLRNDWSRSFGRSGFWFYSSAFGGFTFMPFSADYVSPYGCDYARSLFRTACTDCRRGWDGAGSDSGGYTVPGLGTSRIGSSGGSNPSASSSRGPVMVDSPMTSHGKPDLSPGGDGASPRPPNRE